MTVPLIFSFWFMVAAYVIHIIDESLLGGSFVEKVRLHWWPGYSWVKFFWFNTGYFVLMIASVLVYDLRGGTWVILPLAWMVERFGNGLWHIWWAIRFREYSPGLLTSILIFMDFYFILRYHPPPKRPRSPSNLSLSLSACSPELSSASTSRSSKAGAEPKHNTCSQLDSAQVVAGNQFLLRNQMYLVELS